MVARRLIILTAFLGLLFLYNLSAILPTIELEIYKLPTTSPDPLSTAGANIKTRGSAGLPNVTAAAVPTKNTTSGPLYLPNILLIGAQKSGSSAVSKWLFKKEQGVCGGEVFKKYNEPDWFHKEMHYFDNLKPERWVKGIDFYMMHYKKCFQKKSKFIMDATPDNLGYPERVYETYKDHPLLMKNLKIIIVLREPISRDLSLYNHKLEEQLREPDPDAWTADVRHSGNDTMKSFPEFVQGRIHEYKHPYAETFSYYALHLAKWFQLFDPKQVLVLSYQVDVRPGTPAKEKLNAFLGHPFQHPMTGGFPASNTKNGPQKVKALPCSIVEMLKPFADPWNQELYDLLASHPRPSMETNPFPKFEAPKCEPDK